MIYSFLVLCIELHFWNDCLVHVTCAYNHLGLTYYIYLILITYLNFLNITYVYSFNGMQLLCILIFKN